MFAKALNDVISVAKEVLRDKCDVTSVVRKSMVHMTCYLTCGFTSGKCEREEACEEGYSFTAYPRFISHRSHFTHILRR